MQPNLLFNTLLGWRNDIELFRARNDKLSKRKTRTKANKTKTAISSLRCVINREETCTMQRRNRPSVVTRLKLSTRHSNGASISSVRRFLIRVQWSKSNLKSTLCLLLNFLFLQWRPTHLTNNVPLGFSRSGLNHASAKDKSKSLRVNELWTASTALYTDKKL